MTSLTTDDVVELFKDVDKQGGYYTVSKDVPDLGKTGTQYISNDTCSLVIIPANARVELYVDVDYGGDRLVFSNGTGSGKELDLTTPIGSCGAEEGGWDFNDRISSIKVMYNSDYSGFSHIEAPLKTTLDGHGESNDLAAFFESYNGVPFTKATYTKNNSNLKRQVDDDASSVMYIQSSSGDTLGGITLYVDNDYQGTHYSFHANSSTSTYIFNLEQMNDSVSSFKFGTQP